MMAAVFFGVFVAAVAKAAIVAVVVIAAINV